MSTTLTTTLSPINYVIDGMLPQHETSILAGASGAGKSTLVAQALATIVNGEDAFFNRRISYPVRIGLIAADRSWRSYLELAARVGMNVAAIQAISIVDDRSVNVNRLESDSMGLLFELIQRFEAPDLVVVDPFVTFLGVDANNYSKVAPRLIRVNRFCNDHHVTLLGTHHATKARSDYTFKRAQDRVSGSSALLGFTSTQLFLAAPEEIGKPWAEFVIVPHNRPAETIRLGRDDAGRFIRYGDDAVGSALGDAILQFLARGPSSREAVQAATRIDRATLEDLVDQLVGAQAVEVGKGGTLMLGARGGSTAMADVITGHAAGHNGHTPAP